MARRAVRAVLAKAGFVAAAAVSAQAVTLVQIVAPGDANVASAASGRLLLLLRINRDVRDIEGRVSIG